MTGKSLGYECPIINQIKLVNEWLVEWGVILIQWCPTSGFTTLLAHKKNRPITKHKNDVNTSKWNTDSTSKPVYS